MRARILAVLVAAALAAAPGVAYAEPHAHQGHDSIRYASIKKCTAKTQTDRPCGGWRLVMHSGKKSVLPDAQGVALDAKGKTLPYSPAPIAVSGNGQRVAYFSKTGRLAVRTFGGGVKLFAKNALPRVAQNEMTLLLSDDGGRLAALIGGEKPASTRVFDTATGARLGTVPADRSVLGFSFDGDELLTSVDGDEPVTDLAVYTDTGDEVVRVAPPQVVVSNAPQALSADGRTVANVVQGAKPELVLYDLQTDQVTARKKIKLPDADIHMIDWTGDTQVTLHMLSGDKITIVQIDTETGGVTVRDKYTLLKDTFVFAACGG
ncbi:hypothetical protein [Nonomuraea sp. B19D2]|uniref:hypothetical protein n=1 Tax=Nonomuraea sp. B19D2 TaxID=3159561 RepID=UPI0032D9F4D1